MLFTNLSTDSLLQASKDGIPKYSLLNMISLFFLNVDILKVLLKNFVKKSVSSAVSEEEFSLL